MSFGASLTFGRVRSPKVCEGPPTKTPPTLTFPPYPSSLLTSFARTRSVASKTSSSAFDRINFHFFFGLALFTSASTAPLTSLTPPTPPLLEPPERARDEDPKDGQEGRSAGACLSSRLARVKGRSRCWQGRWRTREGSSRRPSRRPSRHASLLIAPAAVRARLTDTPCTTLLPWCIRCFTAA